MLWMTLTRALRQGCAAALCCAAFVATSSAQLLGGACCVNDPAGTVRCSIASETQCVAAGGRYLGNGTVCTTTSCANTAPTGACWRGPIDAALRHCVGFVARWQP